MFWQTLQDRNKMGFLAQKHGRVACVFLFLHLSSPWIVNWLMAQIPQKSTITSVPICGMTGEGLIQNYTFYRIYKFIVFSAPAFVALYFANVICVDALQTKCYGPSQKCTIVFAGQMQLTYAHGIDKCSCSQWVLQSLILPHKHTK